MLLLRKKLIRKFIIAEGIILGLAIGINKIVSVPFWMMGISIVVLSVAIFGIIVSYPLHLILGEFKALLTGKQYNRIFTKKIDEIGVMANFFNEVTKSIERVSTDIKEHRRISSELNIAQKIQRDLLPQSSPDIPGLDVIAKTKPAAEIGGDSFDFIVKDNQTFMYIGDVTGHGVPSGLVMMIVDTLIHTFVDMVENSHQMLTQVNKYLKPRIQNTMFMTMVMLRWEHQNQHLFFTGAGHETIIYYRASDQTVQNLKVGGIALGMVPNNENLIREQSIQWEPGDFIILYSDGIVEGRNVEGAMFGIERFLKLIEKWAPESPSAESLFQKIAGEFTLFIGKHIQEDDVTLIVIRHGEKHKVQVSEESESTQWESGSENNEQKSLIEYGKETIEESGLKEKTS